MSSVEENSPLLAQGSNDRPQAGSVYYVDIPNNSKEISCEVCNSRIDISNKRDQHVVKCETCSEATPIRDPPTGKKYVRCPCNCLLVCKATAGRIACPRASCKRIINTNKQSDATPDSSLFRDGNNMRGSGIQPSTPSATASSPGMCRVMCGHCSDSFMFNSLTNSLARCPFCRKLSSVGPDFARYRGIVSLVLFLILTTIGSLVVYFTLDQHQIGLNVLYVGIFFIAAIFMFRSFYYLTMKVSFIESQAEHSI